MGTSAEVQKAYSSQGMFAVQNRHALCFSGNSLRLHAKAIHGNGERVRIGKREAYSENAIGVKSMISDHYAKHTRKSMKGRRQAIAPRLEKPTPAPKRDSACPECGLPMSKCKCDYAEEQTENERAY